jgi:hypothetical protein
VLVLANGATERRGGLWNLFPCHLREVQYTFGIERYLVVTRGWFFLARTE